MDVLHSSGYPHHRPRQDRSPGERDRPVHTATDQGHREDRGAPVLPPPACASLMVGQMTASRAARRQQAAAAYREARPGIATK